MEFAFKIISYQDLKDDVIHVNDQYCIAQYEYEPRKAAFLANPNLLEMTGPYMYLALADNMVVGRITFFDTKLKVNDEIIVASTGSALLVKEEYRKYAVAIDLMTYNKAEIQLTAGVSQIALPLYYKMRYIVFKFPKLRFTKCYLNKIQSFGVPPFLSNGLDYLLKYYRIIEGYRRWREKRKVKSKYKITKVAKIPEWVDDVVLNDGHKYTEVHDQKWFQWNLDYNFKSDNRNTQSFYIVYEGEEECGFFMTKERLMPNNGNVTNIVIGSIVEWGVKKSCHLTEKEINVLALDTFSNSCSYIDMGSDNEKTLYSLKKIGFRRLSEDANILFRNRTKETKFQDAKDQSMWRLRLGFADTIMSY